MAITGVGANISLLRDSYLNTIALGDVARAQDFEMTVDGGSGFRWLVQAATTPALKREVVETVGQMGVRSIQQGRFMNEIEMAITFKEVVSGKAYTFLQNWSEQKLYKTVVIALKSEQAGTSKKESSTYWEITECWIELDGADLSVEDAAPLKLSGTLHGSYFPEE